MIGRLRAAVSAMLSASASKAEPPAMPTVSELARKRSRSDAADAEHGRRRTRQTSSRAALTAPPFIPPALAAGTAAEGQRANDALIFWSRLSSALSVFEPRSKRWPGRGLGRRRSCTRPTGSASRRDADEVRQPAMRAQRISFVVAVLASAVLARAAIPPDVE